MTMSSLARAIRLAKDREPVYGRLLYVRPRHFARRRRSRDVARHSSDEVWSLVEKMMNGDVQAAAILNDVIEEGVSGGKTIFVKIIERARRFHGRAIPEKLIENQFAAITPGRSITLFGVERNLKGGPRGYVRRFAIGDIAKYGSYNRDYMGPITKITAKQVTVVMRDTTNGKNAVFDIHGFNEKNNNFDLNESIKRNQEWSD